MHCRWTYIFIALTTWTVIFLSGSLYVLREATAARSVAGTSVQQTFVCSISSAQPIKGNGESMAYHLPACPSYNETVIGNNSRDRLFQTESDALAAGFRKASNCK